MKRPGEQLSSASSVSLKLSSIPPPYGNWNDFGAELRDDGPEIMMAKSTPSLERELAAYQRLLPSLTAEEGRYALIAGEDLLGTFDTYPDALAEGYRQRGLDPFLVKRISSVEVISYFTRDLRPACHTSQTR